MNTPARSVEIVIEGMDCGNCALGIEKKLRSLGVDSPAVNFASGTASFALPAERPLEPIVAAIESLGYGVRSHREQGPRKASWTIEQKAALSTLLTLPLVVGHMIPGMPHELHSPFLQLAFALPVFLIGLFHFGSSAIRSIRTGIANMDVLIVIGLIASFSYSLYGTLCSLGANFLFYETTATITTFVLIGNLVEARAVRRTSSAIEELARLQPATARRVSAPDSAADAVEIDAAAVVPGDLLLVNTGDRVPADGVITWGQGALDESILTGESLPVDKSAGGSVVGGTIVTNGSLIFRAAAIGEETVLSNIVRLVKDAQTNRPAIQQLGDRVSAVFVPVTLVIAVMTFLATAFLLGETYAEALIRAVAVLVIACPCAMGLATPTAVMVGVGRAAKNGILLRGGNTLEQFASIRAMVFDKTGTLTTGDFKVGALDTYGRDEGEIKSIIRALERHSSHPIAASLVRAFADASPLELVDVVEEKGFGMTGRSRAGTAYTLASRGIADPRAVDAPPGTLFLLENGAVIARVVLSDDIKGEAPQTIAALKSLGIEPIMLSGDAALRCADVGRTVGIARIYSEQRPEEKLRTIEAIEHAAPAAFVGDGVNDAPALARASVGISLSNGTTAAIESARIVLLGGSLAHLPFALKLARATLTTIKQNLFWAFSYNIIAIPLAAAGYLTPTVAAVAMGFSDVMTIGNSMRLRHRKLP